MGIDYVPDDAYDDGRAFGPLSEDGGEFFSDIAVASIGFAQRVKALATTAPLHDLDGRKSQVQTSDYTIYQMAELALHAIDLVTIAMDFDTGARPEAVLRGLAAQVAAQAPERTAEEHARVASWVVENLLNVGTADRGFRTVYGLSGPDGYDRRTFDFKLLTETRGTDGDLYLRASNEAVNVLVGALEVDLGAAHIAADVRLDILIKRGRLSEAQAAAQNARYRTIQYGEMLRQRLEATSRDVRNVDWAEAMPAFLDEALEHIEGRYRAENAILVNLAGVRDTADTAARKAQAARLVDVVRDCLRRHDQLQAGLQAAGRRFRAEQDRQTFTPGPTGAALDLHSQLLQPVLALPVAEADVALLRFFSPAAGTVVPNSLRLVDLFEGLITPPAEQDTLGDLLEEPDVDVDEEPARFPDASYEHASSLLDLDPAAPQRLSGLLADARARQAEDPAATDLPLLVVVRVLAMAAQEIGVARRHHDRSVVMALDDGTALDDPEFAGTDLLVARAEVLQNGVVAGARPPPAPWGAKKTTYTVNFRPNRGDSRRSPAADRGRTGIQLKIRRHRMSPTSQTTASSVAAVVDASRLVSFALRPKQRPARDETYAELVRRFREDDGFAELVKAICLGLDLVVLDTDDRHGLVVASTDDSVFAVKMSDYARRTGGEGKAAERVLHALAHLGAATLAYPRPADLSNHAYVGRVTVNGVEAFVREACRRLRDAAAEAGEDVDPSADTPDLEAAWRVYQRRAATPSSGDGRRVASSTIGMVGKALAFLADQGMLIRRGDDDGGTYATTSRYRVQVAEAGRRMFAELLALGITEITDGSGTLTHVEWTEKDIDQL